MLAALLEEGMSIRTESGKVLVVDEINLLENPDLVSMTVIGQDSVSVLELALDMDVEVIPTVFEERFHRDQVKERRR